MINIAIADDHELVRMGLRTLLMPERDIAIVAEAADLAATLALLGQEPTRGQVDVLVLDLPLDATPELHPLITVRARFPDVAVLVLSAHPEERLAVPALRAGASGYVCKRKGAAEVVAAVRKIGGGGRYISPAVAELLAQEISKPPETRAHEALTGRELEVFRLLGTGMSIKQAAAQLGLSISSVNTYRNRIFRKMGLRSNAALIRYAIQHRLVA